MLGGHKGVEFTLRYRLELTPEESQLVDEYKLHGYPLTWTTFEGTRIPEDTIQKLVAGRVETVSDVTTLLENEETVKAACDSLPPLFSVVRSFGGDEVVEYPRADI